MPVNKCKICGKDILNRHYNAQYCSTKCRNRTGAIRSKQKRQDLRKSQPKIKCPMCENFIPEGQRKACSKACTKKLRFNKPYRRKLKLYTMSRNTKRRSDLIDSLGGACEICGYNKNYAALCFHHKDPKTKRFQLDATSFSTAWETLLEEAKKCLLLCHNCHMEIHYPNREISKNHI